MVTFKLIPGCDNYYAGTDGRIYSNFKGCYKALKPNVQTTGNYYYVSIVMNRKRKTDRVHRLVCLAFHGIPKKKMTASHLNGNWKDNRPENLCWETYSVNHNRKKEHGTDDVGFRNSRAKITEPELLMIRILLASGELTHKEIGKIFRVGRAFITKINTGQRYKNQGLK